MEIGDILNRKEWFRDKIVGKKMKLERSKVMNQELAKLQVRKEKVTEAVLELEQYLSTLSYFKKIALAEDVEFRDRRVEYLNELITEKLQDFFPYSDLRAKIAYNDKYNNTKAELRLIDTNGNVRKPAISEGKLCQYLINFAAVDGVVSSLGYNNIYIDEAFGVSSQDNLPRVGAMLKNSIDAGMQIILVSQNAELYSGIPRHELHLQIDAITQKGKLQKIVDY